METVAMLPDDALGKAFIPPEYLPGGKNEFYLREKQQPRRNEMYRNLRSDEIEVLVKNGNTCDNWDTILVSEEFTPSLIKNSEFFGLVRIGRLKPAVLCHHDLKIPAGITSCRIISSDIGDDPALHTLRYLAHYIIGNRCILMNIDEMHVTDHAKFGNGILKDGESEDVRVWLEIMNEGGDRSVLPFDGMITADAYIWARYRDDRPLQKKLLSITQKSFDSRRGYYGTVGNQSVIKNSRIIKDVKVGSHAYIKGANKLKNLTINSNDREATQIGEGVELVNGIIGYGCKIFYGCKAVRFILGNNSNIKYGGRLLNSFLGDNSTVSCCEMLNNLIFPAHEQHHNNSFLIASLVMGQSNLAAGATIGSNHNSRANDNEIRAGRGFWPGLCTTVKHSCRFASFVLLAKGDYPAELNIPLPFSLLNDDVARDRLEIMPAFWWMYNMYALTRNSWKFQARDKRKTRSQHIEFDFLAPDTVEEIFEACRLLELWTGKALLASNGQDPAGKSARSLIQKGRTALNDNPDMVRSLTIHGEHLEKSKRHSVIVKCVEAYAAYKNMLHYYAVKNCVRFLEDSGKSSPAFMKKRLAGPRETRWINIGGQLVTEPELQHLLKNIKAGRLKTWNDIHRAYDYLWETYPLEKQRHAYAVLLELLGTPVLSGKQWNQSLDKAVEIQEYICEQVFLSRKKDFENPFRLATYRNTAEMRAVCGTAESNSFVHQVRRETAEFKKRVARIQKKAGT
ncbi:MAG: DUF4954 family protein [Chitinivibrionales bacterium]|nr:DUF4954 family protein [Chitinivibrionales bacterium]